MPKKYAIIADVRDYEVVDTEHPEPIVIARCKLLSQAQLICNALNFNHRPYEYGYKLVEDE